MGKYGRVFLYSAIRTRRLVDDRCVAYSSSLGFNLLDVLSEEGLHEAESFSFQG